MAQFDFLDNVKNTLQDQFAPQQGAIDPALPPNFGDVPNAPDIGVPNQEPTGLEQFAPPEAGLGIPEAQGGMPPPEAAQAPPLGAITIKDLLGMGLDALLIGLLSSPSPMQGLGGVEQLPPQGGLDATTGQQTF